MRVHNILALGTLAALGVLGLSGCEGANLFRDSGSTVTGPGVDASIVYDAVRITFEDETGETLELFDDGATFELSLDEEEGTFESTFRYGATDADVAGSYDIDGTVLTFSDDPFLDDQRVTELELAYEAVGDVLLLESPELVLDLDNDGFEEVGSLDFRLEPRDT